MAKPIREDFILNDDGDFPLQDTIINGVIQDTPYGDSENQHKLCIVKYEKGHLKYSPIIGFGIDKYLNSETSLQTVEKNLRQETERDGYSIKNGAIEPDQGGGFVLDSQFIYRK